MGSAGGVIPQNGEAGPGLQSTPIDAKQLTVGVVGVCGSSISATRPVPVLARSFLSLGVCPSVHPSVTFVISYILYPDG